MSEAVDDLVGLLDLEYLDVDLFRGRQPDSERQRVYGGQVAAQALVAAVRTVDPDFHVHSMHSYFLLPGDYAVPIIFDPIFSGLAWTLIFGLFASTLFTLFVIPVAYWLLYANTPGHGAVVSAMDQEEELVVATQPEARPSRVHLGVL